MIKRFLTLLFAIAIVSCAGEKKSEKETEKVEEKEQFITLYTHRHYDTDKEIFKKFEEKTGIEVKVVKASADELIQKMESEGDQSPADLLITVDAGRLVRAKAKGLLQSASSEIINKTIPAHLKDADNNWFGLTKRARIIVYDKNKVKPEDLSTYEALTEDKWKSKILIRSSGNIYNQSLLASIIANNGKEKATEWAEGMVNNFARSPKGNDRDQVKAILAGEGELAVINTYYLGKLINSEDENEVNAGNAVSVFFPNQEGRGAHINISGIGMAKNAPNKENAIKFIEYLVSKEVQEIFANANYEYPVNPEASPSKLLNSWGAFKEDQLPLTKLGELNKEAVIVFDEAKWK
ncbi:MAG: Fe(3+) ABC transporter substrate-binding protein [Flavobacteriaceae bacterium]|nr:Fe(3+) ABC transporter substrate-binding protein [Flavobacteriaceae bacterium]